SQSVAYFYMPADLAKTPVAPETRIRLGGLVGEGSVVRDTGSTVEFAVTDGSANAVMVKYTGILPDLFREGQGVVTEGMFATGTNVFIADTVLAKHDETYLPKDVADRLKAQGLWKEGQEAKATP
ncbi:cytochrome c maturation protein CcmE, partial [Rhizobium ruizarguesonis]